MTKPCSFAQRLRKEQGFVLLIEGYSVFYFSIYFIADGGKQRYYNVQGGQQSYGATKNR